MIGVLYTKVSNWLLKKKKQKEKPVSGLLAVGEMVRKTMALGGVLQAREVALLGSLELTPVQRDVLAVLRSRGPLTMASLARARGFSRQNARVLVHALASRGLVELKTNPEHRRSALTVITPAGVGTLQEILHREGEILGRVAAQIEATDARRVSATLERLAELLKEG